MLSYLQRSAQQVCISAYTIMQVEELRRRRMVPVAPTSRTDLGAMLQCVLQGLDEMLEMAKQRAEHAEEPQRS